MEAYIGVLIRAMMAQTGRLVAWRLWRQASGFVLVLVSLAVLWFIYSSGGLDLWISSLRFWLIHWGLLSPMS